MSYTEDRLRKDELINKKHGGVDVFGSFENWVDTFSIRDMYDQNDSLTTEVQPV